jgi:ribosome maturation factor RimP
MQKKEEYYFLRIFIENAQNSISLDDCEIVSRKINDILDEADYIKEQYF